MDNSELRKSIHNKLVNLVRKTLEDKDVGYELYQLMNIFGISEADLTKEILAYNLGKGVDEYENKHYQQLVARLTLHFHNLVKETYHRKRQAIILGFLRKINPSSVMDVGYGTPGPYLLTYMSENKGVTAILADQDLNAEEFAKQVIINKNLDVQRFKFQVYDMDTQEYPGDADMYLFLDSIEHTKHPTEYLNKIVSLASEGSYFVFSIPVCSMKGIEGFHYYEWLTDESSRDWIRASGLEILDEGFAYPNPNVDYFAQLLEGDFHNHLVLARKYQ